MPRKTGKNPTTWNEEKSTIPPKRTGRPTKYTDALADEICRRIAEGEMLMQIVRDEHMPERKTVYNWMNEHDDFYTTTRARARCRRMPWWKRAWKYLTEAAPIVRRWTK